MSNDPQPPSKAGPPKIADPGALDRFFQLQEKEVANRSFELALRKQESEQSYKFSEKALDVQAQDNDRARNHFRKVQLHRLAAAIVIVFSIGGLSGWALYLNKDAIVMEALKIIGSAIVGGIGGYGLGRIKAGSSPSTDDPTEDN